jgi:SNF2 family DNA or RNA helicase
MQNSLPLWEHQKTALEKSKSIPNLGLFFDLGTGKTRTMIEILTHLYTNKGRVMKTLIFGPSVVVENWKREILRFSNIEEVDILCLQGTGKKRLLDFEQRTFRATTNGKGLIVICNYQTILMQALYDKFIEYKFEVLVCDESHRLKNHKAKTTNRVIDVADQTSNRYILTGTPILNSMLDIFSQFRILDKGESFGKNYFVFLRSYFYDKNAGMPKHNYFPNWVIRPNADSLITDVMKKKTLRVEKKDCLDLPPLIREKVFVELSREQRKHYEEMKKLFVTYVLDQACVASLAITKGLRLQQIVSGFVAVEGESAEVMNIRIRDNPRIMALKELLEDLAPKHKIIVWACFQENYKEIRKVCDDLNLRFAEVHGEIKDKQKEVDKFNLEEDCRILIGNQGAGGIGINLVSSDVSIYYSRNFSLEQDLQSEARNYRGGSEIHEKVVRIDLVAKDTIDENILEALYNKQSISEAVLKEIAKGIK